MIMKRLRVCCTVVFAAFVSLGSIGATSWGSPAAGVVVALSSLVTSVSAPRMTPGAPERHCVSLPNGDLRCWDVPAPMPDPKILDDNGGGPGDEGPRPPNKNEDECTYTYEDYVGYVCSS